MKRLLEVRQLEKLQVRSELLPQYFVEPVENSILFVEFVLTKRDWQLLGLQKISLTRENCTLRLPYVFLNAMGKTKMKPFQLNNFDIATQVRNKK